MNTLLLNYRRRLMETQSRLNTRKYFTAIGLFTCIIHTMDNNNILTVPNSIGANKTKSFISLYVSLGMIKHVKDLYYIVSPLVAIKCQGDENGMKYYASDKLLKLFNTTRKELEKEIDNPKNTLYIE